MKPRDIIIIAAIAVLFSPIAFIVMLLATNNARIEFGESIRSDIQKHQIQIFKPGPGKDSLLAQQSKTFSALQLERADIAKQRERMQEEQRRIDMTQAELEVQKDSLIQVRKKLEGLVKQSDELEGKRIKQLARVYTAMKAPEAAQIIETLDDHTAAKLINAIGDERQRGKIMAVLSREKATKVSQLLIK